MTSDEQGPSIAQIVRRKLARTVAEAHLDDGGWVDLSEGVATIVDRLKTLREEGAPLRPDVYLFCERNRAEIERELGFHHRFQVGRVARSAPPEQRRRVFDLAIKKCAPLARGGWSLFIKWDAHEIDYGVMRRFAGLTSVPPRELIEDGSSLPIILIYQMTENVVAVRAPGGASRDINFAAVESSPETPERERRKLIDAATTAIDNDDLRGAAGAVLSAMLHEAIVSGRGFLVGLKDYEPGCQDAHGEWTTTPTYHPAMADGNYFEQWPIPLHAIVDSYLKAIRAEAASPPESALYIARAVDLSTQLQAWVDLVPTLLGSDGMTLLDSKAQVLGFNIFVYELSEGERRTHRYRPPPMRSGGARWRAFKNMCQLVDAGALKGAYFQSQDGAAHWYGPPLV